MKCKHCGAEIVKIHAMGGLAVCWAAPATYWAVKDAKAHELITPNGIRIYGNLTGDLQDAVGIGYLPHTCRQMFLIHQGRDSWGRPVYKGSDGNLYVDVDPRQDRTPKICTKYQNRFDGEPDTPVHDNDFFFVPKRDVW